MRTITVSIQSVASVLSGTDNPTALVDWISSFLRTLEKFNGVVGKIATVRISITLCSASPAMLIRCLDPSLRTSSVDHPLVRFEGLPVALYWSHKLIYGFR